MFYIRADANATIGSGHIMRCLVIANALKRRGEDTVFITADREAEQLINNNGFQVISLDTTWNHLDSEFDKLKYTINVIGIKKLLLDSYFITEDYLARLRKITKTIYIDDLNEYRYPVDMLINYSLCADQLEYEKKYTVDTRLLIGSNYTPLREEFSNIKRIQKESVTDILITTGGSDAYNIAGTLIKYIRYRPEFDAVNLHVVVGAFNTNRDKLAIMEETYQNVIVYYNVTRMSELMKNCDIALSAGGTTLYELCACGIPSICFTFADNQIEGAKEFDRQGLLYYAGDVRISMESCIDRIISKIKILNNDEVYRRRLSKKVMTVVDGMGANRIAEEILMI